MPYYKERRRHDEMGRLLTAFADDASARPCGFDGDGCVRGSTARVWWRETPLETLPDGVTAITDTEEAAITATREATKPRSVETPTSLSIEDRLARLEELNNLGEMETLDSGGNVIMRVLRRIRHPRGG